MAGDLVAGVGSPRFLRPRFLRPKFLRPRFLRPNFGRKAGNRCSLPKFRAAERGRPEVALDTRVADGVPDHPGSRRLGSIDWMTI